MDGRELRCGAPPGRPLRCRLDAHGGTGLGGQDGTHPTRDHHRGAPRAPVGARALRGERYSSCELILSYSGPNLSDFERDAERIRQRLGEMEELGVDLDVRQPPGPLPGPVEWLQAFAATFMSG